MYYVYVLQNELEELYFGSTSDLKRRLSEHQSGKSFATKNSDWKLVYYEAYFSESDAHEREHKIKSNTGTKKHLLNRIAKSRQRESKGRG
ncbi:endonuclease [bacterium]|nr:endonuclease [bacterium]|tara:strand:- start:1112 stop:1381 length:270 start_codon:yes stop_codon:yes gene_type:complete